MALHAINAFDKVEKWSPEKNALQKHHYKVLQRSENRQVLDRIYRTHFPHI